MAMKNQSQRQIIILVGALFCSWSVVRATGGPQQSSDVDIVRATDQNRVQRSGGWQESRFRFAKASSLQTNEEGASISLDFEGTGIAVRLGGHNVPAYGAPNLGRIVATIDGGKEQIVVARGTPREITLARGLAAGRHNIRLVHRQVGDESGARVESFRVWKERNGDVQFSVSGEEHSHLVDCRAILRRGDTVVRDSLVRNWLTGSCSLTGIPPGNGYRLEIRAEGWVTKHLPPFEVRAHKATTLPPVYMRRDPATVASRVRLPQLNRQAVRQSGEQFRARFLGFDTTIDHVMLTRRVGPAVISRQVPFEEDESKAHYYDREVICTLPKDIPPGLYDLSIQVTGGRRTGTCRSPRSVHVVSEYPTDPVIASFGHLDTSAQHQAEYLRQLAEMINLISPDMVLCSNACNPAYVSGSLAELDMPYIINFGNHQFPGHEAWYGDPVGLIDFGPHVSVLNFGHLWFGDNLKADALLASRPTASVRIINAFESNAPLDLLNRHRVRMIHDAHGIGKKVDDYGTTPTRRIGKSNSESFRIVRFRDGHVESCTYRGHETAPIPFPRESVPPLSVSFERPNDGAHELNSATVTNRLVEQFPGSCVRFVVPAGEYTATGARLESGITSDDGKYTVLTVRVDIPADESVVVAVQPLSSE